MISSSSSHKARNIIPESPTSTLPEQNSIRDGFLYKLDCSLTKSILIILSLLFAIATNVEDTEINSEEKLSFLNQIISRPESSVIDKSINLEMLNSAKSKVKQIKSDIWNKWDVSRYPKFLTSMHVPKKSYELQILKFQKLILEKATLDKSYIIAMTGSSITAGHDNYFNESYPVIVENVLKPVFSNLGIYFEVRNGAIGNNPCFPYDACVATHMGSDIDILTWEQSMNCGRDPRPLEAFTRSSLYMPKKPTVMYFLSGTPSWTPGDCSNITSFHHTEEDGNILSVDYKELVSSSTIMNKMTFLLSSNRSIYETYSGLAPMGQSVMGLSDYKCQGPYGSDFSKKSTGSGAAWHPGKKGHELRADVLSYLLLSLLEEAIGNVYEAKSTGSRAMVNLLSLTEFDLARSHPPPGSHIPPIACSSTEECRSEPKCFTDYLPRQKNSLSSIILGPTTWDLNVSFFDTKGVMTSLREGRGYIDRKMVFISRSNTSELYFKIEVSSPGSIWLCQLQKGFLKYPPTMGDLNQEALVHLYPDSKENDILHLSKETNIIPLNLSLILDPSSSQIPKGDHICYKTNDVPRGSHVISIKQKGSKQISLSYLIYW